MRPEVAKALADLGRDRPSMDPQEFSDELAKLLRIMFPRAPDEATLEMQATAAMLAHWLTLLIDSRIKAYAES